MLSFLVSAPLRSALASRRARLHNKSHFYKKGSSQPHAALGAPHSNRRTAMADNTHNVVLIDMDNTLVDWDAEFGRRWAAARPSDTHDILKSRRHFDLEANLPHEHKPLAIKIMSEPGFYSAFDPLPGAIDAVREMSDAGLHVVFCTAPTPFQWESCVADKFAWVRKWLGEEFMPRLVITRDKTVVKGRVLIDDKPHVTGACANPDWTHVLFEQPYNVDLPDRPRMSDWKEWRGVLGNYFDI